MKNEGGELRNERGSETAEANGPGYEGAAHKKQVSILAEGAGFVLGMLVRRDLTGLHRRLQSAMLVISV